MERVKSILEKLNAQVQQGANANDLLNTVYQLQAELANASDEAVEDGTGAIVVRPPRVAIISNSESQRNEAPAETVVNIPPIHYRQEAIEVLAPVSAPEAPQDAGELRTTEVSESESVELPASKQEEFELATPQQEALREPEVPTAEQPPISEPAPTSPTEEDPVPEPKIVEELVVDEAEIEAELGQIKEKAESISKISGHVNPVLAMDLDNDIPTFAQQENGSARKEGRDLNEAIAQRDAPSLNERLSGATSQTALAFGDTTPVKDLRKAISINEKFSFVNELFRGDEAMYNRSIKTLNNFSIYPEAEFWIRRELKTKLGWDESAELVKLFDHFVRRRFS